MSTFIAVDKSGRQVCEGDPIYWAGRETAIYQGLAGNHNSQPTSISISWECDPASKIHRYDPRSFEISIIEMPEHSDYRTSLAEIKIRVELARMTSELFVLPGTNPSTSIELTWTEALALEMALGKALA